MDFVKGFTALLLATLVLGTAGCDNSGADAGITNRVKHAFSKEPALKASAVSVSTDQKVVHLSGTVKSRDERATLIAVARKVEGVKGVKTDLVVQGQPKTAKTAVKPQPKARVEAQKKSAPQRRVAQREPDFYGR